MDLEVGLKSRVYHLLLGYEEAEAIFLEEFDNLSDGEQYAKQQYFLYTGDYPFITTGMNSAYKSTGSRDEIPIPENLECKLINPKKDEYEYIIIVNQNVFKAHSLNPFAEW